MDDDEDAGYPSLEETLRAVAQEISRSVERFSQTDIDDYLRAAGIDPDGARSWLDEAGHWLRAHRATTGKAPSSAAPAADPLRGAAPHPLDVPTDEQGRALAALDSGRWRVEPGTDRLATAGVGGPGPDDALGLVRELRMRDWIAADGSVTLAGGHALSRWLEAAEHR